MLKNDFWYISGDFWSELVRNMRKLSKNPFCTCPKIIVFCKKQLFAQTISMFVKNWNLNGTTKSRKTIATIDFLSEAKQLFYQKTAIKKHPQDTVLFLERIIKVFKKEKH